MSEEISVDLLEPMRLAQILDRSLKLIPGLFRKALPWYIVISLMAAAQNVAQHQGNIGIMFLFTFLQMPVAYYAFLAVTLMASSHWLGDTSVGISAVSKKITFGLALRVIGLSLVVGVCTALWAILLIIPGIVYSINRILSCYILIIEGTTVKDAIKKSKFLMTREKWYRFSSPWARVAGISLLLILVGGFSGGLVGGVGAWVSSQDVDIVFIGILLFIGNLVIQFFSIFSQLAFIGLYYDLRARYEGADLVAGIERLQPQGAPA